jgi:N-formylglutamate amidohydrolase
VGDLWRGGLPWSEAHLRIEQIHTPYHARLGAMLRAAHACHGAALLLDIHSMPPLAPSSAEPEPPQMVVGDRFGASADSRLSALAQAALAGRGHRVALNHPYPGFYLLERHGRPLHNVHAVQIEVSRALYLDADCDAPGDGLAVVQESLMTLADALIAEVTPPRWQEAAE